MKWAPVWSEEADFSSSAVDVRFVLGQRFAGVFDEFRLEVKGIHLTRRAIHHEKNTALGFPCKVRGFGGERIGFTPTRAGMKVSAKESIAG
jgi:hypothetical protein